MWLRNEKEKHVHASLFKAKQSKAKQGRARQGKAKKRKLKYPKFPGMLSMWLELRSR